MVESYLNYNKYDENKPTILEVIDPGCNYCRLLFENLNTAEMDKKYNISYIAYPIPNLDNNSYRFASSKTTALYLEAIKQIVPFSEDGRSVDWSLIEQIFTGRNEKGYLYQSVLNDSTSTEQTQEILAEMLSKLNIDSVSINRIKELSQSDENQSRLNQNKNIVIDKIRTVKIPTIIVEGRRYDKVLEVDYLKSI
jgi:hypothetical protein